MNVQAIYDGSDAAATCALYERLVSLGPAGVVARFLFGAQKASSRAKLYRCGRNSHGSFRSQAYDRKGWALQELCKVLESDAPSLGITWGWKKDPAQEFHCWVLYVVLPGCGQVSFHSATPIGDQRFAGDWDGTHESPARILAFTASTLRPPGPQTYAYRQQTFAF